MPQNLITNQIEGRCKDKKSAGIYLELYFLFCSQQSQNGTTIYPRN